MKLKIRLARIFMGRLSQDDLLRIASEILDERLSRMSREEQLAFLQRLVKDNLEWVLADLDRPQRTQLMNHLLPLVIRHFPLEDVDILGAFGDVERPQRPDWEESHSPYGLPSPSILSATR